MRTNLWLTHSLRLAAWLAASVLLFILLFLLQESSPLISEIGLGPFFQAEGWYPQEGAFQLTPMLLGSLFVAGGAVLLATPMGIIVALFGQFYAPPTVARLYRGLMELLAGVPSVVFGFWGLVVLVPFISRLAPPGASLLAGALVLALMILPLVALTADAALASVPQQYMRGAAAMGLSRWGTIRHITLPVATPGILSGVVLQTGRALGETMAVLMVCGNVVQVPSSWFEPVRTLTANIALEMSYAVDQHRTALFVSGLLLLLLTITLVVVANYFRRMQHE